MSKLDLIRRAAASTAVQNVVAQPPKAHRSDVLKGVEQIEAWVRQAAKEVLSNKVSDASKEQYRTVGVRLDGRRSQAGEPVDLSAHGGSKSTYYAYRAALRFHAAEQAIIAANQYDKARKEGDVIKKAEAYQRMLSYAADLKQYPKDAQPGLPDPKMVALGLQDEKQASPIAGVKKNTTTDNTKLKDTNKINKMFPEWKALIWGRLKEVESPWIDQAAIASLTGCRPVELERGITVENKGDRIVITIPGAKVREHSGQPWRRFTIKNDGSAEWTHLASRVAAGSSQEFKSHAGDDAFTKALERAGAQVLPKAPSMSAYVYRHSIASDMKADGASKVEIAMVLGHAVTKTQNAYGRAIGGRAGSRSMSIEAAREVKVTHDTRYTGGTPAPVANGPTDAPQGPSGGSFSYSSPSFDL